MMEQLRGSPKTYKIIECLHENKNSKIFKVLCSDSGVKLGHPMVLKLLNSRNSFQDCINEFRSLKAVKSPYCVSVYNWENLNNHPGLVLEYVEGVSLKELYSSHNFSNDEYSYLAENIHRGLLALRNAGVSHGDLSPSNIMIDSGGNIKLIDYGMANLCGRYTPSFVAPEVISNSKYSYEADLFSLGKIMQFLGSNKSLYRSLLELSPTERSLNIPGFKKLAKQKLAKKVNQQLFSKNSVETQVLRGQKPPTLKCRRFLALAIFFLVNSSTMSINAGASIHSYLTIKTPGWYYLKAGSLDLGYSPFFAKVVPSGKMELLWKGKSVSGQSTLTLKPGEHKVITSF